MRKAKFLLESRRGRTKFEQRFFVLFSNQSLSCLVKLSNTQVFSTISLQATSENGGWITSSELSVRVHPNDRNKMISCYAVNQELGETIQKSHMVSILCKSKCLSWPPENGLDTQKLVNKIAQVLFSLIRNFFIE